MLKLKRLNAERREMNNLYNIAKCLREQYPKGTRIVLLGMGDDPRPILPGTRGTVDAIDDMATVHCSFDNGRRLGLVYGEDHFRALTPEECAAEQEDQDYEQNGGMTL